MYYVQVAVVLLTLFVVLWAISSLRVKATDLKKEILEEEASKKEE